MIRALFIILAVLAAVLAYLMGYGWLYLAAGLLVLAALGLLARDWQRAQRKAERPYTGASASREEDLSSLGIMEIREKQTPSKNSRAAKNGAEENDSVEKDLAERRSAGARTGVVGVAKKKSSDARAVPKAKERARAEERAGGVTVASASPDADEPAPGKPASEKPASEKPASDESERDEQVDEKIPGASTADEDEREELGEEPDPVLAPYLEALRAALGARAAALLVQEDVALTYRVEALAGRLARTHARGYAFSTEQPLLTASMARRPVTLLRASEEDALGERLGYYRAPVPEAAFVALAPVPRRAAPANHFLVADAPDEGFTGRAEALMERFATLLSFMINASERETSERETSERETSKAPTLADAELSGAELSGAEIAEASAPHAAGDGAAHPVPDNPAQRDSTPEASDTPAAQAEEAPDRPGSAEEESTRPRRDIIAEEIGRARATGQPLAFALVYLNRADAVAGRGAVEQAEPALRARLKAAAPESRLEPFGELAYGLFYRGAHADVEDWAMDVQRALAEAEAPLDGGVSIGIALLNDDLDDPEALREHATRALHEAYTTGTCTILE